MVTIYCGGEINSVLLDIFVTHFIQIRTDRKNMQFQLIRSATLRIEYAQHTFVIDPYLAAKHTRPTIAGISHNPLVDLPCSPLEVIAGIEMVIVSHLHSDHFDPAAQDLLPKNIPIL